MRYLRDRRLNIGVGHVLRTLGRPASDLDALVVCGGVGGEGTYLANAGFRSVTVSDFSQSALDFCRQRDPRLSTKLLDAEDLALPDDSYDLVIVQDGLHHLPRPALGFTEMLRVARLAVVVIEPHTGIVSKLFGVKWETDELDPGAVNWVFRWNTDTLTQLTNSLYPIERCKVVPIRVWDHNVILGRVARVFGGKKLGLRIVKILYGILNVFLRRAGNMMVGVVFKPAAQPASSTS